MTERLKTERLILRRPEPRDYPQWERFVLDDRSRFVRAEPTVGVAWRGFCNLLGHWQMRGYGVFAITRRGEDRALGGVGPWFPGNWPEKELGWTIWDPADEGQGLITEAAAAARAYAFETLGWRTAVSYIAFENDRSVAVAKRLGCTRDEAAASPDDEPCFVYRHPRP